MSDDVSDALKRRRERRERMARELENSKEEEDDAAARREQRKREREARRRERENEAAAEEESASARRRRRQETEESRSSGRDTESASARRRREKEQQEEEERKRKEQEEREQAEREERERREREREEQEAEERRQREKEEAAERRRREREEESSYRSRRSRQREEEERNQRNQQEEEEEEEEGAAEEDGEPETIFDTMSPQKKASILEGLADEFRRIVEQREAKGQMVSVSAAELDELDLKVRSLRTQVRKAEETNNQLTKQKREIDEKLKKNENELNKLRTDLQKAEAENDLAIKEGKKVAPKLPSARGAKKASPPEDTNNRPSTGIRENSSTSDLTRMRSKHKSKPPPVKPKPKSRTSLGNKETDHEVLRQAEVKIRLPSDCSIGSWTSGVSDKAKRLAEKKDESRIKPPPVKAKPFRAKIGDRELSAKDLFTVDLKAKLMSRKKGDSSSNKDSKTDQGHFNSPADISHTRQGNFRKFAKHRRSVRQKRRHRPTSNPVRQLNQRTDVRCEL